MRPLSVAVEALVESGADGGIEQYLIGLLNGLNDLNGREERYAVVESSNAPAWFYSAPQSFMQPVRIPKEPVTAGERAKRLLGPLRRPLGHLARRMSPRFAGRGHSEHMIPKSDGFWEQLGVDLVHFTYHFEICSIPTIFTLHDLQHRHLPQFFSDDHLRLRETLHAAAFHHSKAIVTVSKWVKEDLIRECGIASEKIFVVPLASPAAAYPRPDQSSAARIARKLRLPSAYMLYPSLTYAHKNHERLLQALALLRDRDGLKLQLICTGAQRLHWARIQERLLALDLTDQVRFLGFLPVDEFRVVFARAQYLVFPSLFEGAGIPLLDAFLEGLPVTCSDIPAFREYGGDAPLFFDPLSVEAIAAALKQMSTDAELRFEVRKRGDVRNGLFNWTQSAKICRAVYRMVARRNLSQEDEMLLQHALESRAESGNKTSSPTSSVPLVR